MRLPLQKIVADRSLHSIRCGHEVLVVICLFVVVVQSLLKLRGRREEVADGYVCQQLLVPFEKKV